MLGLERSRGRQAEQAAANDPDTKEVEPPVRANGLFKLVTPDAAAGVRLPVHLKKILQPVTVRASKMLSMFIRVHRELAHAIALLSETGVMSKTVSIWYEISCGFFC